MIIRAMPKINVDSVPCEAKKYNNRTDMLVFVVVLSQVRYHKCMEIEK